MNMGQAVQTLAARDQSETTREPSPWALAGLRPTGIVVFATVDRPSEVPVYRYAGGWDGSFDAPLRPSRDLRVAGEHPLRRVAGRGAAWLLGR